MVDRLALEQKKRDEQLALEQKKRDEQLALEQKKELGLLTAQITDLRERLRPRRVDSNMSSSEFGKDAMSEMMRDGSQVEVFQDGEGAPVVPATVVCPKFQREREFVSWISPYLRACFPGRMLVNSEEVPWLRTSSGRAEHFQKPDLFAADRSVVSMVETTASKADTTTQTYGKLCHWVCRDCVDAAIEAKLSDTPVGWGEAISYQRRLSHHCTENCRHCKKKITRAIFVHPHGFRLLQGTGEKLTRCVTGLFSQRGTQKFISEFFSWESPWITTLREGCKKLGVSYDIDSFIGAGAFGRTFCVTKNIGKSGDSGDNKASATGHISDSKSGNAATSLHSGSRNWHITSGSGDEMRIVNAAATSSNRLGHVLKVCLDTDRLRQEFELLCRIHENEGAVDVCVSPIEFVQFIGSDDSKVACYLMSPCGRRVERTDLTREEAVKQVFTALDALHDLGFAHGDARIANLIRSGRRLLWIDLAQTSVAVPSAQQTDRVVLGMSILDSPSSMPPSLKHTLQTGDLDTRVSAVWQQIRVSAEGKVAYVVGQDIPHSAASGASASATPPPVD